MKKAWLAAALVYVASGCADAASGDPVGITAAAELSSFRVDLKAERAALLAADGALNQAIDAQGIPAAYGAALADDARFLAAGAGVLQGRATIQAWLAAHPSYSTAHWTPASIRADVSADGTLGYTFGSGLYVRANGTFIHLRVINTWRKLGGEWKVVAAVFSGALGAAGPAPEGFGTPTDNGVQGAPASAGAGELENVLQADRDFAAYAVAHGAQAAFTLFAAPTAVTVGVPSYGPDAINAEFAGTIAQFDWAPIHGDVGASGDLGYTIGRATIVVPGFPTSYTQYITVWQRQPDGAWKYVADGGNPAPPPAQ